MNGGRIPQEEALSEALEDALQQLEAGATPQESLSGRADLAEALLPLVEAASQARERGERAVPPGAQQRSRTRMLLHAEKLRSRRRPSRFSWPFFRRLSLQGLAVLVVLVASLTGLAAASAQTIPGDQLYGLKRTVEDVRLNLSQPQARGSLERAFRERRLDEIRRVIADGRQIAVDFEGVVNQTGGSAWQIAGFTVLLDEETSIQGEILPGMLVRVLGRTTARGEILAGSIQVIAYAFTGPVDSRTGEVWVISGVPVLVTVNTQVAPGVAVGVQVVVLAQVSEAGTISARAILLADVLEGGGPQQEGAPGTGEQPDATTSGTPTATPTATQTRTATPTRTRTPSPFLPTPDDDDKTEKPESTESEEPETPEATGSEEPETPEPTKTDKPDDD